MPKLKDTDFLYLSGMVRERENRLISPAQLDRIIRAETDADAAKILEENGWGQIDASDALTLDRAISARVAAILKELAASSPEPRMIDAFRIKYDYHNAKVLIKSERVDIDGDHLMSDGGRVPRAVFEDRYYEGLPDGVPPTLGNATLAAREILQRTGDAQAVDLLLDRAMYQEYLDIAQELKDDFFTGYVRLSIDAVNLRTAVRAVRMGMEPDALIDAFIPGGNMQPVKIVTNANLQSLYKGTLLERAAGLARETMAGGAPAPFERETDNALTAYLKKASFVSFGIAPIISYMAALESEAMAVRIVMASRSAGLSPEEIRERLRD